MSLAWADSSSEEIWAMVFIRVATVARSAAVAVARFVRSSTVSYWWSAVELKASTALARGKCCPVVRRKFSFHSRCAFAKCSLKFFKSRTRGGFRSLLQVIVKYTRLRHAEEGSINNLIGCKRYVPQFCVGYAVGGLIEERFDWGVRVIPRRHLLLVFLQVELVNDGVGGDQVVEELLQGHLGISRVFMLEGLVVNFKH